MTYCQLLIRENRTKDAKETLMTKMTFYEISQGLKGKGPLPQVIQLVSAWDGPYNDYGKQPSGPVPACFRMGKWIWGIGP